MNLFGARDNKKIFFLWQSHKRSVLWNSLCGLRFFWINCICDPHTCIHPSLNSEVLIDDIMKLVLTYYKFKPVLALKVPLAPKGGLAFQNVQHWFWPQKCKLIFLLDEIFRSYRQDSLPGKTWGQARLPCLP